MRVVLNKPFLNDGGLMAICFWKWSHGDFGVVSDERDAN
jgi:hypothetical protein